MGTLSLHPYLSVQLVVDLFIEATIIFHNSTCTQWWPGGDHAVFQAGIGGAGFNSQC